MSHLTCRSGACEVVRAKKILMMHTIPANPIRREDSSDRMLLRDQMMLVTTKRGLGKRDRTTLPSFHEQLKTFRGAVSGACLTAFQQSQTAEMSHKMSTYRRRAPQRRDILWNAKVMRKGLPGPSVTAVNIGCNVLDHLRPLRPGTGRDKGCIIRLLFPVSQL